MNLWHDKSYIAPSGPNWVERGYAIEAHCLDDIFPFSEECSQYCNQHNKRKLVCERRGEHGR